MLKRQKHNLMTYQANILQSHNECSPQNNIFFQVYLVYLLLKLMPSH